MKNYNSENKLTNQSLLCEAPNTSRAILRPILSSDKEALKDSSVRANFLLQLIDIRSQSEVLHLIKWLSIGTIFSSFCNILLL